MIKWMTPVIYTLIALAIFFVGIQLVTNTSGFLKSIIMMIGMAALVYGAIYFLFLRNRGGGGNRNEMKKYKEAVKQSKQKYKTKTPKVKKSTHSNSSAKSPSMNKKKRNRKNSPKLRVIEGNKSKEKNRATF